MLRRSERGYRAWAGLHVVLCLSSPPYLPAEI